MLRLWRSNPPASRCRFSRADVARLRIGVPRRFRGLFCSISPRFRSRQQPRFCFVLKEGKFLLVLSPNDLRRSTGIPLAHLPLSRNLLCLLLPILRSTRKVLCKYAEGPSKVRGRSIWRTRKVHSFVRGRSSAFSGFHGVLWKRCGASPRRIA